LEEKSGFTEQYIHGRFIYFEKVQVKESFLTDKSLSNALESKGE